MKNSLILIALTVIVICSCKKDKEESTTTTTPVPYGISSSDVGGIGDTFKIAVHTVLTGDNAYLLGGISSGQIWDYDSIPFTTNIDTTFLLNPSSNPDYSLFPTSNLLSSDGSVNYMFLNKSTDKVDLIGISLNMLGNLLKDTLGNPWTVMKFPMQLGTSYNDSGSVHIDYGGTPPTSRVKLKYKITSNIDAGGTVKTPTGTYECVRNYRVEYLEQYIYALNLGQEILVFSVKDTTYKYNYWTKSKKWNVIEIETDKNNVVKSIGYLLN